MPLPSSNGVEQQSIPLDPKRSDGDTDLFRP